MLPRGIAIVYEDEDFIVVDKPAGIVSSVPPGNSAITPSVFGIVKTHVARAKPRGKTARRTRGGEGDQDAAPSNTSRVFIVHRLDRDASGLLIFAKTQRSYDWLKEDLKAKRIHRLYNAVVEGELTGKTQAASPARRGQNVNDETKPTVKPGPITGTIQSFIREVEPGLMKSGSRPARMNSRGSAAETREVDSTPKLAVTHYRVVAAARGYSLLQVRLETGRKNQIRVHMQELGHPIVGDGKYGAKGDPIRRLALHATELGFSHPATGEQIRLFSPLPPEFRKLVGLKREADAEEGASEPGTDESTLTPGAAGRRTPPASSAAIDTGWDHVAHWYDELLEGGRSDHHSRVILPGVLRLLEPAQGQRVLDVACGQGMFCRRLAELGVDSVGVDASPKLITAARTASRDPSSRAPRQPSFVVADARELGQIRTPELADRSFDAATCIMALMNIEPIEPVLAGIAALLKPGGRFVAVFLHPAFRAPGQTKWGWDQPDQRGGRDNPGDYGDRRDFRGERDRDSRARPRDDARSSPRVTQYRRVDGYLSPGQSEIVMNPGEAARGRPPVTTLTFHRPLQAYVRNFAAAGMRIDALEEWPSMRTSQPGPRAAEENRARREIPLFCAVRAVLTEK